MKTNESIRQQLARQGLRIAAPNEAGWYDLGDQVHVKAAEKEKKRAVAS